MIACRNNSCAVLLVPVGPSAGDVVGMQDLVRSVGFHEPQAIEVCVLVDDAPVKRDLTAAAANSGIAVISNPRNGAGLGAWGGLCAGVLHALRWIHEHTSAQWVLKMDTDALAIAPFAEAIGLFFAAHPEAGVIGCLGETANRSEGLFQWCLQRRPRLAIALDAVRALTPGCFGRDGVASVSVPGVDGPVSVSERDYHAFNRIRPHVERGVSNGMTAAEYCQGGAYAVSREMIARMAAMGFLDDPAAWVELPFGEDEAMAMYCRAVNLKIYDFSDRGQPFGVRYKGLPFEPPELIARGHALIHSVRSERYGGEAAVRRFYADQCESHVRT